MRSRALAMALCVVVASCGGGGSGGPPAVNPPALTPPAIAYGATSLALTTGVPLVALSPTNTGGAVAAWSVAPALPAGLALNATSGTIDGTPTSSSSAASYVVRAENSAGASTHTLTIAVESGVVLELGHATDISFTRYDGTRILSGDNSAHWGSLGRANRSDRRERRLRLVVLDESALWPVPRSRRANVRGQDERTIRVACLERRTRAGVRRRAAAYIRVVVAACA